MRNLVRALFVSLLLSAAATFAAGPECMIKCRTDFAACQRSGQAKRKDCIKPCRDNYAKLGCPPNATGEACPGLREVQQCRNACAKSDREGNRTCRDAAKTCRDACVAAAKSADSAKKDSGTDK